jgi:hypothetical protein
MKIFYKAHKRYLDDREIDNKMFYTIPNTELAPKTFKIINGQVHTFRHDLNLWVESDQFILED